MSYGLLQAAARIKGLKPQVRCVLINLADRANRLTKRCYPSVRRIAADTCVSEREVYRALKNLCESGLVSICGKTTHGTNVYILNLAVQENGKSVEGSKLPAVQAPDSLADQPCHTVSGPLTNWQTNNGIQPGTEEGKEKLKTSADKPLLAATLVEDSQDQANQGEQAPPKQTPPPVPFAPLPGGVQDSKLVQTWKAAHANAGLKCYVTGIDGQKLSLLVKGKDAIAYHEAREILIPRCVADWADVCKLLIWKYNLGWLGKKHLPKWPHTGFLLANRKAMLAICLQTKQEREDALFAYVPKNEQSASDDESYKAFHDALP